MSVQRANSKQRTGFTLVEMLVVLGITALLAAILFPVIGRVKERRRNATCQSNLKQIGLAMQQYVADNDGAYPQQETVTATHFETWTDFLQPYLKSKTVFYCPSQAKPDREYFFNFYQLNASRYKNGKLRSSKGKLEAILPSASSLVVSFDCLDVDPANYEMTRAACGAIPAVTMHSGGANFVYADGHVKWLSVAGQQQIGCDLYRDPTGN